PPRHYKQGLHSRFTLLRHGRGIRRSSSANCSCLLPFSHCSFLAPRLRRCCEPASAIPVGNPMILDIARLLLFPALMAFAAATDLFTMTISNRVSVALAAGFLMLAPLGGMGLHDFLTHLGAGATVLVTAFACFAMGWVGGGDAKVA